jgi:nucleotide-binding universal stress UspA family protein
MDKQRPAPVVVGVDGSETALRAVSWAAREARRRGAPLRIVHAAPYVDGNAAGERHASSILRVAHTVAGRAAPGLPVVIERLGGPMPRSLADAGAGAQLLVVGMTGGNRLDDVLLHAAALKVCELAPCPVAVVRCRHGLVPADGGPVVLGLEDLVAGALAVTAAFADAQRHASHLVVLHAGGATRSSHPRYHPGGATFEHALLEGLGPWRSRHPSVPVDVKLMSGAAATCLLEASARARLVVLGTRARKTPGRLVVGSTSRTVLRGSSCPVLLVRRDAVLAESAGPPATHAPGPEQGSRDRSDDDASTPHSARGSRPASDHCR